MTDAARLPATHPLAHRLVAAIIGGDVEDLQGILADDPALARCLVEDPDGGGRSTLHLLADAPGGRPRAPETLTLLVAAGADLNAAAEAMWHLETPLHWAASNDDVVLIHALLDAGADIEAPGSSIGGGPPIQSALGYGMDRAVARLHERGAQVTLVHYVVLGLIDQAREAASTAEQDELDGALWNACARGDTVIARILIGQVRVVLSAVRDRPFACPGSQSLTLSKRSCAAWRPCGLSRTVVVATPRPTTCCATR